MSLFADPPTHVLSRAVVSFYERHRRPCRAVLTMDDAMRLDQDIALGYSVSQKGHTPEELRALQDEHGRLGEESRIEEST